MNNKLQYWARATLVSLMDCLFLNISLWFSCVFFTYLLKTDSPILMIYYSAIPMLNVSCFLIFMTMGVHKRLWGHIYFADLLIIMIAVFLASFFAYVALRIIGGAWQNPILAVTTFYLFLSLSAGTRMLPSLLSMVRRSAHKDAYQVPLLIVGAGEAADALIKDILSTQPPTKYRIVGLVDDDEKKHGHKLRGVNILGSIRDIATLTRKYNIQEIIIAIPSATTAQRQQLIAVTLPTGCKVRFMSRISALSQPTVADLHELDIGDLLGRHEVLLNPDSMATYLTGSVVLITGAGGSIGSELCRQVMRFDPKELILFDQYENNASDLAQELRIVYRDQFDKIHVRIGSVQDVSRLEAVFNEFHPDVVFHAAAYKHVPLMEECPYLAIENNVFGTLNTAEAAIRGGVRRFVMISTDKAVNPANVMGASKRIAELMIHSLNGRNTEFVAVRFGNVLGSNGSVVPIFRRQIETGGPITITHPDIIRYFMTIPEAARLVLQAGAIAQGGETFVLDMGEPVKIVSLAKTMIEMAGLVPEKDIEIVYTGLRPGEKLYEELLFNAEEVQKTTKEKIYVAHAEVISEDTRNEILRQLRDCIKNNGDMKACLQAVLPEYSPNNGNALPEDRE